VKRLALLAAAASLAWADAPRIFYSRLLPGGVPPYVEITVERDGRAVYREAPDDRDDKPIEFRLRPHEVEEIFALAEKVGFFRKPLESGLKVANTGLKTFRYIAQGETSEVKFNYSQDPNARLLADWFARMIETEQHYINLERTVRFDKLGVNKVLLQLQASMERNRVVAPDQFLPFLDRIAAGEAYLNMARERAANLAGFIRAGNGQGPK
jgi:hypothetical protein